MMFRSALPTVLPHRAKQARSNRPMAHSRKDRDMMEVLPERTAPSQIRAVLPV